LSPRTATSYFLLALTALFWSGNFVVGRGIQGQIPPIAMAFGRWLVAFCVLLPFALAPMIRERDLILRNWKMLLVLGILGAGSFNTLVYIGLGSTTATNGLLLNSAIPILVVVIGWLFLGQRVTGRQAIGICLSLCGVAAIIFRGEIAELLALRWNPGDIWVFTAMVFWAVYTLLLRRRPAELSPIAFLGTLVFIGMAMNLPLYLAEFAGGARAQINLETISAIVYFGVFPAVLAYLFWNRGVAEVGPAKASLFIHLMPVFGTLLAIVFLGESLHVFHVVGFVLIMVGIVLTTVDPRQKRFPPRD
jgi:drug/metabolite transporter (DMT)-like permease